MARKPNIRAERSRPDRAFFNSLSRWAGRSAAHGAVALWRGLLRLCAGADGL
ncbi:hypothetical protein JL2886_00897 [Phaeobacter gallaeciensis]|uniref:Uncharacterized protein n=1 Tax=Phaeobacter gallaeciensis TaxID=60890 RepID=A0A1B0ZNX8_9RHOB|nr:hypothetical protein JL2886_00897 [Phaeobacter gallaeciensis]